jgi:uroporphyrin-III C-methyltransferase
MAIKHLSQIAEALVAEGRNSDEPVAVVSKASTADQQVLVTTLGSCAADVVEQGIEPPSLVVVGEVVRLRTGLDWLGALSGRVLTSDPLGLHPGRHQGGAAD